MPDDKEQRTMHVAPGVTMTVEGSNLDEPGEHVVTPVSVKIEPPDTPTPVEVLIALQQGCRVTPHEREALERVLKVVDECGTLIRTRGIDIRQVLGRLRYRKWEMSVRRVAGGPRVAGAVIYDWPLRDEPRKVFDEVYCTVCGTLKHLCLCFDGPTIDKGEIE